MAGCLLRSFPANVIFDNTTGYSFTCDLTDNIVAPWPSSASVSSLSLCAPGNVISNHLDHLLFSIFSCFLSSYFTPLVLHFDFCIVFVLDLAEMSLPALPTSETMKNPGMHR